MPDPEATSRSFKADLEAAGFKVDPEVGAVELAAT